jgi:hypothetical protein
VTRSSDPTSIRRTGDGPAGREKPPPDAAEAPRGATDDIALDKRYNHQDRTAVGVLERHNRWACCATDRVPVACPRCCRCVRIDECDHALPAAVAVVWS